MQNKLKVVTFNCRGLNSSIADIHAPCKSHDVILLQEIWLAKQDLHLLNNISNSHISYGFSPINLEDGIHKGRLYGGTAFLWNKTLNASPVLNCEENIVGLNVVLFDQRVVFINVYMPYCCSLNIDDYLDYLGNFSAMIQNLNCINLGEMGDYNADEKNSFGNLMNSFSEENELVISDYELLPSDSFTFVSEAHGTTFWLDHCLTSKSMFNCVKNISVLMEYITSDHLPLSVVFSYDHLPNLTKLPQPCNNVKLH